MNKVKSMVLKKTLVEQLAQGSRGEGLTQCPMKYAGQVFYAD